MTGNVSGKSCTGGISLKNVLDLSVLHSYLNQINNKTLTPNPKSGCNTFPQVSYDFELTMTPSLEIIILDVFLLNTTVGKI